MRAYISSAYYSTLDWAPALADSNRYIGQELGIRPATLAPTQETELFAGEVEEIIVAPCQRLLVGLTGLPVTGPAVSHYREARR